MWREDSDSLCHMKPLTNRRFYRQNGSRPLGESCPLPVPQLVTHNPSVQPAAPVWLSGSDLRSVDGWRQRCHTLWCKCSLFLQAGQNHNAFWEGRLGWCMDRQSADVRIMSSWLLIHLMRVLYSNAEWNRSNINQVQTQSLITVKVKVRSHQL